MVVTTDIFLKEDLLKLLKNRFIVVIGDSNQRAIYKDLVLLLQKNDYISDRQLRTKGEFCFENDTLIEGGRRTCLNNGKGYKEVRQYQTDCHLLRFYFVTRCYSTYMESILSDLSKDPQPDVVIMNSCLWDISRYGPSGVDEYKENLNTLFDRFKQCLPEDTLVIWNTTLPIAKDVRGGFLVPEVDFMKNTLRLDILEANFFAKQIVAAHGFDILDLHYHLRNRLDTRAKDGIHWDQRAHRHITNLLLTHISDAWSENMPGRNKPKCDLNGNSQPAAVVSPQSPESNKENKDDQRNVNFKTPVNYNKLENAAKSRTTVSSRRLSSSSNNANRTRRSLDPTKPVTMGEKEQPFIFTVTNANTPNSRKRSFDRLQADLNKVQRDILGMVSTPPSSKGQYNTSAPRDYTAPSTREYAVPAPKAFTDAFQSWQSNQSYTDNYQSHHNNNYMNSLTHDLYQTQYQSQPTYSLPYNQDMNNFHNQNMNNFHNQNMNNFQNQNLNNFHNSYMNNLNNYQTSSFQWQPYAQDNYQGPNKVWSSRSHYKQNHSYYRMSHNF
uniref:PC-esterase domain-containing protein 1A n=1 Tax=Magallana gigas TaxID=29159 RepID=A0A8W8IUP7_MAGGI|nr:GATA zinc finger domain-containing protein 14 [Crassostrea gigas]XP_034330369.1 GATA zinc finger domain-containing protein 14 [Crassostrea gigas]XP_034330370.1 GATA zinc finger domain-containing protein 14 [Crassostrea gigas]XP_034330371.1 GATA zinc finger domain-containing protein 14 [Crassostrea gigas]XP_034330372.1 GATA zinc finger domain-containing protein 14 [Crassostrea gigas]